MTLFKKAQMTNNIITKNLLTLNPKLSAASRLGDTSGIGDSAPSAVPGRPIVL